MQVLKRDGLPPGGFAGVRERRLVMDDKLFRGRSEIGAWPGLGQFVYLADARFVPLGETGMHNHRDIDVVSVMVEGRLTHAGSLHDGQEMQAGDVQVQRAGGEGFSHNEINPDNHENRMLQLWVLPESSGGPAGYRFFRPLRGVLTRVYGGPESQTQTFPSKTLIDVAILDAHQSIGVSGAYLAYVSRGTGKANGTKVVEGELVRGEDLTFQATQDAQLVIVHTLQ